MKAESTSRAVKLTLSRLLVFQNNEPSERRLKTSDENSPLSYRSGRYHECCWTHSVLEARFVSSCFSFPSRARPRFSRLLARNGVRVNTLQKVELGATTSLKTEIWTQISPSDLIHWLTKYSNREYSHMFGYGDVTSWTIFKCFSPLKVVQHELKDYVS